ncbi:MAG TPA: leucyl/phenylalanyl-tRNA--protein transferase [Ferruginibacter sp.]|nr:leucyl/phenylalanyl-tRNA--protein transferase [Ferruginibacter sp.]HRE64391.1 leucyl/phenylalanyl-tRNA--protein transferase [Ferruginibacter sp.]
MYLLNEQLYFPPVEQADESGLLAIGGDLNPQRLLLAYRSGIFPWFNEDEPICWWSPNPRFVLFPAEIKISKSMQAVCKKKTFEFKINQAFENVIGNCAMAIRKGQHGTWITDEMKAAYIQLHRLGFAHSAEAWQHGKLVGGLYGIRLGNVFFGESMFSHVSNASKFAFIQYVQQLQKENVQLVDCQLHTPHLESLGACMISRQHFIDLLEKNIAGY